MTSKGAAQPNRPDETAPPSDGGAVSPGAADAPVGADAGASAGAAGDPKVAPDEATNDGGRPAESAGRADRGRTGAPAADSESAGEPGGTTIDDETASSTAAQAGAAAEARESAHAGSEPADATASTEPAAPAAGATASGGASDGKESEDVTNGKTVEEAVARGADQSGEDVDGHISAELETLRGDLGELTRDLQRVTAEYANYRKRVDRDRTLAAEQATGGVLLQLLPVLDDLDRAREHGDLVGPFGSVADQLIAALTKFGLTAFGAVGDPFDPTLHEAVSHTSSPDVTETTCVEIMRRGYLLGERMLRPALVGVADPE